ncbi:MAG: Verru_Chthon cassette protein A [Blastochloris sp.]|nr:Verru_Chthon cassette protein A [Blastochloris sp.]
MRGLKLADRKQKGAALIIVLGCLVLMAVMTLAFLAMVKNDSTASSAYAGGSSARLLADSAMNLVIGQIKDASERSDEAWISQPGLIRTYDTEGKMVRAYKLYSSPQMIAEGENSFDPSSPTHGDVPVNNWADRIHEYVDLNSPVQTAQGFLHYPIVSPEAETVAKVEGFDINLPSAWGAKEKNNAAAMPVRWLYVLKDGTLAAGVTEGAASLNQVKITGAGVNNPPVARLAFWADDESAKININTAAEGTFHDSPIANTYPRGEGIREVAGATQGYPRDPSKVDPEKAMYDLDLSYYQPAQKEYQRYPGHPATTSLSTVLYETIRQATGLSKREDILDQLYLMTPRYNGGAGSSRSGTVRPGRTSTFSPGDRRLYASLDEFIFQPEIDVSSEKRIENKLAMEGERREVLDQIKFFMTAVSKSPEQTLFNTPRMSIWPIHNQQSKRTTFDKMIQFCSELVDGAGNKKNFGFLRQNPLSMTEDWNLGRNVNNYQYLQSMTSRAIPGFTTSTFQSKWGVVERDQILTQIVDYIRCTNLLDDSMKNSSFYYTRKTNEEVGVVLPLEPRSGPGVGTKGFGRYMTISELCLAATAIENVGTTDVRVQFALVPEFFSTAIGHPQLAYRFRMEFNGLSDFRVLTSTVFPSNTHTIRSLNGLINGDSINENSYNGGSLGYRWYVKKGLPRNPDQIFPVGELVLSKGAVLQISGKVDVELWYDLPSGGSVLVQKGEFVFPSVGLTLPTRSVPGVSQGFQVSNTVDPGGRLEPAFFLRDSTGDKEWARSLVPSMSRVNSDYRITSVVRSDEDLGDLFEKHPWWNDSNRLVHSLRPGQTEQANVPKLARVGKLSDGLTAVSQFEEPDIVQPFPAANDTGVRNSLGKTGDWTSAVGQFGDGALIDRADEGEAPTRGSRVPYFGHIYSNRDGVTVEQEGTYFSPNRLIPSPITFGSLPTGAKRGLPWQTLLFRPNKPYLPGEGDHPGAVTPPDHLLLDLFWMPVVEPYAISEPFSTAGKINLNTQMVPFSYIKRDTGLRAVLKSVMVTALNPFETISSEFGGGSFQFYTRYKLPFEGSKTVGSGVLIRHPLNLDATLKYFEERITNNEPFISASEICTVPLVPTTAVTSTAVPTVSGNEAALTAFWQDRVKLTGDNLIERPYSMIYPRVTTKSNTYQVHVRSQLLNAKSVGGEVFQMGTQTAQGEFRGSFVIERYLDPNTQTFDESDPNAVLGPYRFRVISSKQVAL